jgi:hypothetical protein
MHNRCFNITSIAHEKKRLNAIFFPHSQFFLLHVVFFHSFNSQNNTRHNTTTTKTTAVHRIDIRRRRGSSERVNENKVKKKCGEKLCERKKALSCYFS